VGRDALSAKMCPASDWRAFTIVVRFSLFVPHTSALPLHLSAHPTHFCTPKPCLSPRKTEYVGSCNRHSDPLTPTRSSANTRPPTRLAPARPSRRTACPSRPRSPRLLYAFPRQEPESGDMANAPQCQNCRREIVNTNKVQLEAHAESHNADWPKEKCWPNDFK
jgi:hypothetical protein